MTVDYRVLVLHTSSWAIYCNHLYAGPPLQGTIKLLSPLTELEELNLGGNKLGGTIAADVAVFAKLKKLSLYNMGLGGKSCMSQHTRVVYLLTFSLVFLFWRFSSLTGQQSGPRPTRTLPAAAARASGRSFSA